MVPSFARRLAQEETLHLAEEAVRPDLGNLRAASIPAVSTAFPYCDAEGFGGPSAFGYYNGAKPTGRIRVG